MPLPRGRIRAVTPQQAISAVHIRSRRLYNARTRIAAPSSPPAPQALPSPPPPARCAWSSKPPVTSLLAGDPSRRRLPMARDKTVPRGQRHYADDPPRRSRNPPEEFILCDGEYINPQVESYAVLPKASTRRQIMKRAMCLKSGSYGNAVIVFSLSEKEKLLLSSMGSAAPPVAE